MANVGGIILDFFGDLPDTFNEALLRALEGAINWLTEGQNKKHFKSIFLPDEGSKSIKDLLQSMEKQVRRMEERTNELVAQGVGETHRNTNQSRVELPVIRHDANLAATNTDKMLESISRQNIQRQHDREQLARIEQYGVDAKNGMFNLLFQRAFSAAWSQGLYQGRMLAVSAPFMDQDAFEKMSAFSALTAMLTSTIGSMQPAKVVQFFCGRHTSTNDPLGGPNGLIRGILAQLLQQGNFSLSFIDSRTPKEYIERHPLAQLTDTLKRLVHQLDRRVILFIFVDGVSLFERSEWIQDLNKVMYDLGELTWNKTVAATVKFIVTNPGKSRSLGSCVASEDRVLVPFLPSIRGGKLMDRMINKDLRTLRGGPAVRQEPEAFDDMDSEGEFDLNWLSAKGEVQ
ncbi:hypothetical protein SLS57_011503 [Botryosphaeria dothidea]